MEKNVIIKNAFQALYNCNLIFNKKNFQDKLTSLLAKNNIELHEKSINDLLKEFTQKGYLAQINDFFNKTDELLSHTANKQFPLLRALIEKNEAFETENLKNSEIKILYIQKIKETESPPEEYTDFIGKTYEIIKAKMYDLGLIKSEREQSI